MEIKQAVFFVGGKGTRIKELSKNIPKPLIVINNIKFIEYLIKNISLFGINKVLLLCGYKSNLFFKYYHNKSLFGVKIICIKENNFLGTAGALYNARRHLENFFYLSNGDTFCDINFLDFFIRYKKKFLVQMLLFKSKKKKYDQLNFNKNIILNFGNGNQNSFSNAGSYLINKKVLKFLRNRFSLEKDVFPNLAKKKLISGVFYKNLKNRIIDIGTPKDLKRAPKILNKLSLKPALFLDRDGVINKDLGYVFKKNDFKWRKGIKEVIKYFNDRQYWVLVVTNQSGIGRGYYTEKDMNFLHNWMNNTLYKFGAHIDKFYYAPFYKYSEIKKYRFGRYLRKPNSGMIKLACRDFKINLKKSILIGDNNSDLLLAKKNKIKYKIVKFSEKKIILNEILN